MGTHKSRGVAELARKLSKDRTFQKRLEDHIHRRRLVNELVAIRGAKGLSQQALAEKMGCTQSRISKIEKSEDSELHLGSIVDFANALGLRVEITVSSGNSTAVEPHKPHTFRIQLDAARRRVRARESA